MFEAESVGTNDFAGRQITNHAGVLAPTQLPAQYQIDLPAEILLDTQSRARRAHAESEFSPQAMLSAQW